MTISSRVSRQVPATSLTAAEGDLTLTLRAPVLADAPAIADAIAQSRKELLRFMPWAHYPQTSETQRARLVNVHADYWSGRDLVMLAVEPTSGAVLGSFGLHDRSLNPKGLEIGYWVSTPFAGRGYATLATRMLIVYGFERLELDVVRCSYNAANDASRRVQEKCGFKLEGRLRHFEDQGTREMRAAGFAVAEETVMTALTRADRAALPWYDALHRTLVVRDWLGELV
jgi:RimJ/RimL family protein N-acetyltransferase